MEKAQKRKKTVFQIQIRILLPDDLIQNRLNNTDPDMPHPRFGLYPDMPRRLYFQFKPMDGPE